MHHGRAEPSVGAPTDAGAHTWHVFAAAGMESNASTGLSGPPGAPLARTQAVSGGSRTSQLAERDRDEAGRASEAGGPRAENCNSADRVAAPMARRDGAAPNPPNATTPQFAPSAVSQTRPTSPISGKHSRSCTSQSRASGPRVKTSAPRRLPQTFAAAITFSLPTSIAPLSASTRTAASNRPVGLGLQLPIL